jgi:hypothetical protein
VYESLFLIIESEIIDVGFKVTRSMFSVVELREVFIESSSELLDEWNGL